MIRVWLLFLVACFAGLFIQGSLIHSTIPSAPAPDFILVLVVIVALRYQTVGGVCGVFVLGLLDDFASARFLGPSAAGAVVAFLLVGVIASRVFADRSFAIMLITFICSLAKSFVYVLMYAIYLDNGLAQVAQLYVLQIVLLEALFSALVAPIILKLITVSRQLPRAGHMAGNSSYRWFEEIR